MTAALVRFLAEDAPGADALYVLGICSNSGLGTTTPTRSTARWPMPGSP